MNLEDCEASIHDRWFKIFESSFLILKADENTKSLIVKKSICGVVGLNDVIEVVADRILKDWKSLKVSNGEFLPYSKSNAVMALTCNGSLLNFVLEKSFGVDDVVTI